MTPFEYEDCYLKWIQQSAQFYYNRHKRKVIMCWGNNSILIHLSYDITAMVGH